MKLPKHVWHLKQNNIDFTINWFYFLHEDPKDPPVFRGSKNLFESIFKEKSKFLYNYFLGHSNGGAVASLVFLFLLEKFKYQSKEFLIKHFKCITFGLMPFANNMFKHYIEAIPGLYDCICHIVHKNDIVPKLFGSLNMTSLKVC